MSLSQKKILMACSNPWNSVLQVGSHHLARELLKMGYEVAFISNPISPLHLFKGTDLKKRLQLYFSKGVYEEKLWPYVPAALLTPYNLPILRSRWIHQHWHQLTFPSLVKKVIEKRFDSVDILYFDTAIQSFWLKKIRARKTVFRIADQTMGFKQTAHALISQEKQLAQSVDLVLCTAKTLADQIPGSLHFPNGVSLSHFQKQKKYPEELKPIPKPIAIYVGAIDYWFDFSLLKKLAQELLTISFVLIGPIKENPFSKNPNIYCLGPKKYSEIPNYLKHSQVGIIPFDVSKYPELIHHINPLKLYEYMACSLPVVTTCWQELKNIDSPALLSHSFEEFKMNLKRALAHPNPKLLKNYVKRLDWSIKTKQLINFLR